jgi:hypothetical protein
MLGRLKKYIALISRGYAIGVEIKFKIKRYDCRLNASESDREKFIGRAQLRLTSSPRF